MSPTLAGALALIALFVAVLALVFAVQALRRPTGSDSKPDHDQPVRTPATSTTVRTPAAPTTARTAAGLTTARTPERPVAPARDTLEPRPGSLQSELRRLRQELAEVRRNQTDSRQRLAVARYDAFGEKGGRLSWSVALLDGNGDGVVLTAINSRNDARSYAKQVRGFASETKLSPEEEGVVDRLRRQGSAPVRHADHE